MNKCKNGCDFHYYPAINEDGWRCVYCENRPGDPPGFSPQLDREMTYEKVGAILWDACEANLISVSNGSEADWLAETVAARCVELGRFDQYSILFYLVEIMLPSHAKYWAEIGESIIAGADKRDRCQCGKLARISVGKARYCSNECMPPEDDLMARCQPALDKLADEAALQAMGDCICGHSRGRHITPIHGKPLGKCYWSGCKCKDFALAAMEANV